MNKQAIFFSFIFLCLTSNSFAQDDSIIQQSGGLHGYISVNIESPSDDYGYGVSFYTGIWPLLKNPLSGFQIGLPSTWIIPNNNDFTQALCPAGTVAGDHWPERGPYYREVFQTIEGGLGFWANTRFPSAIPKYRINCTPNCYNNQISSPGWGFGETTSLAPDLMGLAQLSNKILIPPDGITFDLVNNGLVFGVAWMVLPISLNQTTPEPTGNQSWTLFFNAANYAGPVAFYIPNTWSQLSQTHPEISGRGLDSRPAIMSGGAMEINTVPYFLAQDLSATTYTKIPQLQFPVDENGQTILMQSIYFYSKKALYEPFEDALQNSKPFPNVIRTNDESAVIPICTANQFSLTQGNQNVPLDVGTIVHTFVTQKNKQYIFGLQWGNAKDMAYFPAYFKEVGDALIPIDADKVPSDTKLLTQEFVPGTTGDSYVIAAEDAQIWSHSSSKIYTVTLADGSIVSYKWYLFVDQPALQHLNLSFSQKTHLQAIVLAMHKKWTTKNPIMPPPVTGALAKLDPAVLVTPPPGLEYGYVPIVISQSK